MDMDIDTGEMNWVQIVIVLVLTIVLLLSALIFFVLWLLTQTFNSIQPVQPTDGRSVAGGTEDDHDQDDIDANPLFKHFPHLKHQLAWKPLGIFPTPVHSAYVDLDKENGRRVSFWLKREDLSSPIYGGNKVRTLQYQIPSVIEHVKDHPDAEIVVLGSGGSNQVVATMTHGARNNLKFHVNYATPDGPDLDNTLNLLSTLSFGPLSMTLWDKGLSQIVRLARVVTSNRDKVINMGGTSLPGILGQIGGALELAHQIESGDVPDPDEIYLPLGSGCTTTGLILGVCLARHLKLRAFRSHRFKIVSVVIHQAFARLNRKTNCMRNRLGNYLFVSPQFGIGKVAPFFRNLTGIDLETAARKFVSEEWEIVDSPEYIGMYGVHSERSAVAAALDHKIVLEGPCPSWIPDGRLPLPWLCGHFTGKAFAVMLDRLETRTDTDIKAMLWQTKSHVQPLGKEEEWTKFQSLAKKSAVVEKWAEEGKAASVLRPGKVDVATGTAADYRPLMKKVM